MARLQSTRLFIGLAIVLVGTLSVAFQLPIHRQLDRWRLLPRPERLTELYFTDHLNLPATYQPGETHMVAFTVHNMEYRRTRYAYQIVQLAEDGKTRSVFVEGNFTLEHDQATQATQAVSLADMGLRSRIRVELSYEGIKLGDDIPSAQSQSIHYWVDKKGVAT